MPVSELVRHHRGQFIVQLPALIAKLKTCLACFGKRLVYPCSENDLTIASCGVSGADLGA